MLLTMARGANACQEDAFFSHRVIRGNACLVFLLASGGRTWTKIEGGQSDVFPDLAMQPRTLDFLQKTSKRRTITFVFGKPDRPRIGDKFSCVEKRSRRGAAKSEERKRNGKVRRV